MNNEQDESKELALINVCLKKFDYYDNLNCDIGKQLMFIIKKVDQLEKRIKILEEKR